MTAVRSGSSEPTRITRVDFPIAVAILSILSAVANPRHPREHPSHGASQRLTEDIRLARSSAIRGGAQTRRIGLDQSGPVPDPDNPHDPAGAQKDGIERRTGPAVSWRSLKDHRRPTFTGVTGWQNLENPYRGVSVTTGSPLVFHSQGRRMNCSAPGNPIWQGLGRTKTG